MFLLRLAAGNTNRVACCGHHLGKRCVASNGSNYVSSDGGDRFSSGTSVNVHEHRLKRPERKRERKSLWSEEEFRRQLEEGTKVCTTMGCVLVLACTMYTLLEGSLVPTTLSEMREAEAAGARAREKLTKEERLKR